MEGMGTTPIGKRIEDLLASAGKSQGWLAEKSGLQRSTIGRIIKGTRSPTPQTLAEIAPVLGVEVAQLVVGTDAAERVEEAQQWIARSHYAAAVSQVVEFEKQATDLKSKLRDAEHDLAATKDLLAMTKEQLVEARREANRFAEDADRYKRALEDAVADLAQLKSSVEEARTTGRWGAAAATLAAAVSMAMYLKNASEEDDEEEEDDDE